MNVKRYLLIGLALLLSGNVFAQNCQKIKDETIKKIIVERDKDNVRGKIANASWLLIKAQTFDQNPQESDWYFWNFFDIESDCKGWISRNTNNGVIVHKGITNAVIKNAVENFEHYKCIPCESGVSSTETTSTNSANQGNWVNAMIDDLFEEKVSKEDLFNRIGNMEPSFSTSEETRTTFGVSKPVVPPSKYTDVDLGEDEEEDVRKVETILIGEYRGKPVYKRGDTIITSFNTNKYLLSRQSMADEDGYIYSINKSVKKGTFIIRKDIQGRNAPIGYITHSGRVSTVAQTKDVARVAAEAKDCRFYPIQEFYDNIEISLSYSAYQNGQWKTHFKIVDLNNIQKEYFSTFNNCYLKVSWNDLAHQLIVNIGGKLKTITSSKDSIRIESPAVISFTKQHRGTNSNVANYKTTLKSYPNRIAVFVHGTNADPSTWTVNRETIPLLLEVSHTPNYDAKFKWEEALILNNDYYHREKAVTKLVQYIEKYSKTFDEIVFIGHSHGGNVCIQSINHIKGFKKIFLFTIATPAYNCKELIFDTGNTFSENHKPQIVQHTHQENPINIDNAAFQCHVHVGNHKDMVAGVASKGSDKGCGSQRFYENDITLNIDFSETAPTKNHSIQQSSAILRKLQNRLPATANPFVNNICVSKRIANTSNIKKSLDNHAPAVIDFAAEATKTGLDITNSLVGVSAAVAGTKVTGFFATTVLGAELSAATAVVAVPVLTVAAVNLTASWMKCAYYAFSPDNAPGYCYSTGEIINNAWNVKALQEMGEGVVVGAFAKGGAVISKTGEVGEAGANLLGSLIGIYKANEK